MEYEGQEPRRERRWGREEGLICSQSEGPAAPSIRGRLTCVGDLYDLRARDKHGRDTISARKLDRSEFGDRSVCPLCIYPLQMVEIVSAHQKCVEARHGTGREP